MLLRASGRRTFGAVTDVIHHTCLPEKQRMKPRLDLIGIVVDDMARSLAFYRELGLDLPPEADAERHVETTLPGGLRMAWDTLEVIRSFQPTPGDHPNPLPPAFSGRSAAPKSRSLPSRAAPFRKWCRGPGQRTGHPLRRSL